MDYIKGKRVLLLYARFFEYDQIVKDQLIDRGVYVDLFDARANISVFGKALLKKTDKFYKRKQIKFHKNIAERNKNKKYDFVFTNENLYPEAINCYRSFFPDAKFILYLDDSVDNFRHIDATFCFYDRVLTFDRCDAGKYNILFRPLFFNKVIREAEYKQENEQFDICFVGTAHSDRLAVIDIMRNTYPNLKFNLYLFLQSRFMYFFYFISKREYRCHGFSYFQYKKISMAKVVELMTKSKVILDIHHPRQTGLTMRTIESIGLKKKIITTNEDIVNYDFYNPNNVAVIDRHNPIVDNAFFDKAFEPIENGVYERYSIDSWINDVFGGD